MECGVGTKNLLYVIRHLASNNNHSIANCIFYLTKKVINLKTAHSQRRTISLNETMQEIHFNKITVFDYILFIFTILYNTTGMFHLEDTKLVVLDALKHFFYARSQNRKKRLLGSSRLCCLSVCPSVRPSVRPSVCRRSTWNNSVPTRQIYTKYDISVFSEICTENPKLNLQPTRTACTLHEEAHIFMIVFP